MPNIDDQHIRSFYRKDAADYDRERFESLQGKLLNQYQFRALDKSLAGIPTDAAILEVGSGTGRFLEHLEQRSFSNLSGVDQAPEMLVEAGKKTKARLVTGDIYALPFPDGYFDVVYSIHVIMHVEQPATMLQEMLRVSRRSVIIDMNNQRSLSALAPLGRRLENKRRHRLGQEQVQTSPSMFTFREMRSMAKPAKLVEQHVSVPLPLTGLLPSWYVRGYRFWSQLYAPVSRIGGASQYLLIFEKNHGG